MEFEIIEAIEVELKYCERCGGLWLRRRGAAEVYCHICGPKMAEFPEARKKQVTSSQSVVEELEAFYEGYGVRCEEGHA